MVYLCRDIAEYSIRQNFGGLSMIVRFDAFIPPIVSPVNDHIDFPDRLEVPELSTMFSLSSADGIR